MWNKTEEKYRDRPPYQSIQITRVVYQSLNEVLQISIYHKDGEKLPYCILIHSAQHSFLLHKKFITLNPYSNSEDSTCFRFEPNELNEIKTVIDTFIQHHKLIGATLHSELYSLFALGSPVEVIVKELLGLLNADKIKESISQALEYQEKKCFEPLYVLAEALYEKALEEKKIDLNTVYEVFNSISEKSPFYSDAQKKILEILTPQTDEEDNIPLLELKFTHALNSKEQILADRLYDELCGNILSGQPAISNIQGDLNILLKMAAQMRLLNAENAQLKKENLNLTPPKANYEPADDIGNNHSSVTFFKR